MKAYHFTGDTLRNGQPIPPIGEWLEHEGEIWPCKSGLHASEHPFDALSFAPGCVLHLVELEGDIQTHGEPIDKLVGRRRKILASIHAEKLCRDFARRCALDVLPLWKDAPEIVKSFLETGDESLRVAAASAASAASAARYAAWDARDAAWDAARDAAWAAARDAARDAARAAAWDARAAARAAAWDARAAARAAAWDAAGDAEAARAAVGDAARAAAGAALKKYRQWFLEMVEAEFAAQKTTLEKVNQ